MRATRRQPGLGCGPPATRRPTRSRRCCSASWPVARREESGPCATTAWCDRCCASGARRHMRTARSMGSHSSRTRRTPPRNAVFSGRASSPCSRSSTRAHERACTPLRRRGRSLPRGLEQSARRAPLEPRRLGAGRPRWGDPRGPRVRRASPRRNGELGALAAHLRSRGARRTIATPRGSARGSREESAGSPCGRQGSSRRTRRLAYRCHCVRRRSLGAGRGRGAWLGGCRQRRARAPGGRGRQ